MRPKKIMGSGMSREEILKYSDEMRQKVFEHIQVTGRCAVGYLSRVFNLSKDQTRCYVRYLATHKNVELVYAREGRHPADAYYVPTGRQYISAIATTAPKDAPVITPGARHIKLLDKKPTPMTLEERKRLRNSNGNVSGFRGSSMSMFEVF